MYEMLRFLYELTLMAYKKSVGDNNKNGYNDEKYS